MFKKWVIMVVLLCLVLSTAALASAKDSNEEWQTKEERAIMERVMEKLESEEEKENVIYVDIEGKVYSNKPGLADGVQFSKIDQEKGTFMLNGISYPVPQDWLIPDSNTAAIGDINYDNIKLLYVGPMLTAFMDGQIRVVENVPRYIFPLMSQRPFIKEGKAYLPLRLTFHLMGYQIDWKANDDNIIIYNDDDKMILNKATQKITVDGKQMDLPLLLMEGSYFVPLRDLAAATGDSITWDSNTRTITYVKKGSQLVKPPVTITDIRYEPDKDRDGEFARIHYVIKNTSGATIPKDELWYIVTEGHPALTEEEVILRQLQWPGGYPLNEDQELLPNQTITNNASVSTSVSIVNGVPRCDGSGAYEVHILGILDKDPYMRKIYWMPPLP